MDEKRRPRWFKKRVFVPLSLVEAVFVGIGAVGVALWSVPAALVTVSVVGVAACEVRG